jgi:hypothetical protein
MTHRQHSRSDRPATLDDLVGHVPLSHVEGAKVASEAFRRAGVRHVLVGGLAVGLRGYPRLTKNVDFLVGDEAHEHRGSVACYRPGIPVSYDGIGVNCRSLEPRERKALEEFLVVPPPGVVPVVPVEPLVAMKLLAGRHKDQADVVELVKSGVDAGSCRRFVEGFFPDLLSLLDRLVLQAEGEE